MNDKQRAAMQMALKALEEAVAGMGGSYATWSITGKEAITTLREALAQPQEPVALPIGEQFCFCGNEISLQMVSGGAATEGLYGRLTLKVGDKYVNYYTTPPSVEAMRIETLEKAAKVCEELVIENNGKTARNKTSFECAAAIRSMK